MKSWYLDVLSGGQPMVTNLWHDKSPGPLHSLHFGFGLGALIGREESFFRNLGLLLHGLALSLFGFTFIVNSTFNTHNTPQFSDKQLGTGPGFSLLFNSPHSNSRFSSKIRGFRSMK